MIEEDIDHGTYTLSYTWNGEKKKNKWNIKQPQEILRLRKVMWYDPLFNNISIFITKVFLRR